MGTNHQSSIVKGRKLPTALAVYAGYLDARAGRGYRPEYDTMNPVEQKNYEVMRLHVLNMRMAGMKIPGWNVVGDKLPPQIYNALNSAAKQIGHALP